MKNKRVFHIKLYNSCHIYGKLYLKNDTASLEYFDKFGKLTTKLKGLDLIILDSIINQAELICILRGIKLENFSFNKK